jgi:hypothetical protein
MFAFLPIFPAHSAGVVRWQSRVRRFCRLGARANFVEGSALMHKPRARANRRIRASFCSLLLSLSPTSILAQEMRPLTEVAPNSARGYEFVRCGGLYQAVMEWAGRDRLGEDTWNQYDSARTALLLVGVLIYVDNGVGNPDSASQIVARDARNIANLYLARFEANYARQGEMLGGDDLVKSDLVSCREVAIQAQGIGRAAGVE